MLDLGLAIFVKTPGFSPIKTRLSKDLGVELAAKFYGLSVAAVASVVKSLESKRTAKPYWAVAEGPSAASHWAAFPVIFQGEGDLGTRLHQVYSQLLDRHDGVILIGADAPGLTAAHLHQAADALGSAPFVMGPALDGGFYLFGGTRPIPRDVWESVAYSQSQTAKELANCLEANSRRHGAVDGVAPNHGSLITYLDPLPDVDEVRDLDTLREQMQKLPAPLPEQKALLEWLVSR